MKLYIAKATCSLAPQIIANELGLNPELIVFVFLARPKERAEGISASAAASD